MGSPLSTLAACRFEVRTSLEALSAKLPSFGGYSYITYGMAAATGGPAAAGRAATAATSPEGDSSDTDEE